MSGVIMSDGERLSEPVNTLAFCWRIERRDGVTIGLTSHDRDLSIGGLSYRAAPGMTPSAVRSGIGLQGEDSDVAGALSSDAISEADLMAGRWDGAALEVRLTQWEAPGALWLLLARGEMGAVARKGGAFTAELLGAAAVLGGPVAPSTSPDIVTPPVLRWRCRRGRSGRSGASGRTAICCAGRRGISRRRFPPFACMAVERIRRSIR